MNCCAHCTGAERVFDDKSARKDLKKYHKKGLDKPTMMLLDAIKAQGVEGASLLDIGGGIGAIQHELFKAGATSALDVDASPAYLSVAADEAKTQGNAERSAFQHGDFVEIAPDLDTADIVTLDKVICCYPDMAALVGASTELAGKLYGAIYPRDSWITKFGIAVLNLFLRIKGSEFRTFVHPTEGVNQIAESSGLKKVYQGYAGIWQVVLYARA